MDQILSYVRSFRVAYLNNVSVLQSTGSTLNGLHKLIRVYMSANWLMGHAKVVCRLAVKWITIVAQATKICISVQ